MLREGLQTSEPKLFSARTDSVCTVIFTARRYVCVFRHGCTHARVSVPRGGRQGFGSSSGMYPGPIWLCQNGDLSTLGLCGQCADLCHHLQRICLQMGCDIKESRGLCKATWKKWLMWSPWLVFDWWFEPLKCFKMGRVDCPNLYFLMIRKAGLPKMLSQLISAWGSRATYFWCEF